MYYTYKYTPAGTMLFIGSGEKVTGMYWKVFRRAPLVHPAWTENEVVFQEAFTQLDEYFAGKRQTFDFSYEAWGTPFQLSVWRELESIPFGTKRSYKDIAAAIGKPNAVRAVGTAIGSNPLSIVIPCHRVLTSTGTLGGYAGGLPSKILLLQTEGIAFKRPSLV